MRRTFPYVFFVLLLAALSGPAAENPVLSVQRALKEKGFYFGDATGQVDGEARSALRRFQTRAGLKSSGEMDNETLQALATADNPSPPGGEDADPAPPSLRERAHRTQMSDREFLAKLGSGEEEPPAPAPPTATVPPLPAAPDAPASTPSRVGARPPAAASREEGEGGTIPEERAASFIESYLTAAKGQEPNQELSFYPDHVDYFDTGRVSRQFVAQDQKSYYRRWPNREFDLVGRPEVVGKNGPRVTVRFRVRYHVSNSHQRASGMTENVLQLQQQQDGLEIVSIHERRVSE